MTEQAISFAVVQYPDASFKEGKTLEHCIHLSRKNKVRNIVLSNFQNEAFFMINMDKTKIGNYQQINQLV